MMVLATPPSAQYAALPPTALRERVSGTRDADWFHQSGARTVQEWQQALRAVGYRFSDFTTLVDFGCGCGRSLRHLAKLLTDEQLLVGMDIDAEAIEWVAENLAGVIAHTLPPLPPSPLPDGTVDLALCHSVFTHLPEDVQFLWLAELHRILRPGGILVASIHGESATTDYLRSLEASGAGAYADRVRAAMASRGFYHAPGRSVPEQPFPEYYGPALHTIAYVVREWLRNYDLLAWRPTGALDHQDILVLRTKRNMA